MNEQVARVLALAAAYAAATGRSLSTVSRLSTGSGETYRRLCAGRTITIARLERAVAWFSAHWPPGLEWPPDVPRT